MYEWCVYRASFILLFLALTHCGDGELCAAGATCLEMVAGECECECDTGLSSPDPYTTACGPEPEWVSEPELEPESEPEPEPEFEPDFQFDSCQGVECPENASCKSQIGACICDEGFEPSEDGEACDLAPKLISEPALNACADGDEKPSICGLNGRGTGPQLYCISGQWVQSSGFCVDPDMCVEGTNGMFSCGQNGRGQQQWSCVRGQIQRSQCVESP